MAECRGLVRNKEGGERSFGKSGDFGSLTKSPNLKELEGGGERKRGANGTRREEKTVWRD